MHFKEQFALYPYTEQQKQEIRRELGLKESILEEDINAIIEWYYKQPHLAEAYIDRELVEKIIIAAKGSREKAKHKLDYLYKHRSLAPELIQTRKKFLLDDEIDLWSFYRQAAMLKLYNGKRISVLKITDPDPSSATIEELFRNTLMLGDLRMKFDYMLGEIWIIDFENVTIAHTLRLNFLLIQKFINIVQNGIGLKLYEVHMVNSSSATQRVFNIFKPFLKPKILQRFVLHENIENLKKHIPKTHLPKDYGGDEPSLEEFKDMYNKELSKSSSRDYLIACCEQISNEKLRPGDFNEEYLVGSFKKLEVD